MIDANRAELLRRQFRGFLPREDRARYPTYWVICNGIADDPVLLELADDVPPPQLAVNVFLASVHDLLLRGADHDLAHRYPSVCRHRGLAYERADDATLRSEFASFCEAFRDEVAERCRTQATQTNEIGRSAVLRAALCTVADEPIGLLDAGCSAGLNLLVDAYRVDYGEVGVGPVDGPLLRCELRGGPPPFALAPIERRVGLDLHPLDVADLDDRTWLLACLWPDDLERFERLEAAARLAVARRDELTLLRGDMVDDLARAAALVDAPRLVVVTSWSVPYLPPERRPALASSVRAVAASRPTTWVAMEYPSVLRDLGLIGDDVPFRDRAASAVCVTSYEGGDAAARVVAETHHHGRWLDWREG